MGKLSKSLPPPQDTPHTDRASNALMAIAWAMDTDFSPEDRVYALRQAAAEVRAWRKSLGVTSYRKSVYAYGIRPMLRDAARNVLNADSSLSDGARALRLRWAEAYLREAARLLDAEARK